MQSLASLSLVCIAFRRMAQPLLFHTVSTTPKLLRTLVERPNLAGCVRVLNLSLFGHARHYHDRDALYLAVPV